MTSLVIEQFHAPDTRRRALRLESVRRRAADQLAGRSVWCIGAAPLETDVEVAEGQLAHERVSHAAPARGGLAPRGCPGRHAYAALTSIRRGLAVSLLGTRTVSTPSWMFASMCS